MSVATKPIITAFERSPDRGRGLARDMRVRGALEEVGQPYEVRLVSFREMKEPAHRALHPFGQIPTYEDGDLALFESGAIVLHIAERHGGLLPDDAKARARAIAWMFAALDTVEPPIFDRDLARLSGSAQPRRSFEANLELTYLAEIRPGFDLQPVVTHIWNPSEMPGGRNALVVGLRTRLLY